MKDPRYTEAWVDALALRIQRGQITPPRETILPPDEPLVIDPALLHSPRVYTRADAAALAAMPSTCKITRSSPTSLIALRSLPRAASILLFTPAIIPAGQTEGLSEYRYTDPFEPFGRALSRHHKRIRHVPYVAKVGFTEIHDAFISQADAVITVVCEPERSKHESMSNQMDFAEHALDAVESKEANASHALVLVQCGEDEFRPPVDAGFMNVVESTTYDADIAKHIANALFRTRI